MAMVLELQTRAPRTAEQLTRTFKVSKEGCAYGRAGGRALVPGGREGGEVAVGARMVTRAALSALKYVRNAATASRRCR